MTPGTSRTPTNINPRFTLSASRLSSNSFATRAIEPSIAEGEALRIPPFGVRVRMSPEARTEAGERAGRYADVSPAATRITV